MENLEKRNRGGDQSLENKVSLLGPGTGITAISELIEKRGETDAEYMFV